MSIDEIKMIMKEDIDFLRRNKFHEKRINKRQLFYDHIIEKLSAPSLENIYFDYLTNKSDGAIPIGDHLMYPVWIKKPVEKTIIKPENI